MIKKIIMLTAVAFFSVAIFAYNPPVGGEDILKVTEPNLISGSGSASGGPQNLIVPGSIVFNPALTAFNQRTVLDLSYTGFLNTGDNSEGEKFAQGFGIGLIVPSKWFISTVFIQGLFSELQNLNIGNEINFRAGISKDVTDSLSVGLNLYTGYYFGHGSDFIVGADLGMFYNMKDISFLKSPRLGFALLNLGKPLGGDYEVTGLDGTTEGTGFPSILTPRISFASTLFKIKNISSGMSIDLSAPLFQNLVIDTAMSISYLDIIHLSVNWDANIKELSNGCKVNLPAIGISFKFAINSSKISKANEEWAKSEISTSAAWQQLYGGVQALSVGGLINLGMKDTSAPEIILWSGEE